MSQVSGRKSQVKEAGYSFEQLEVYQLAVDLTVEIYRLTREFPSEERFGLTSQIRRASNSVALNIAEGKGRNTDRDFLRFLCQARGSLLETISALQIAQRFAFVTLTNTEPLQPRFRELVSKLNSLISYLEAQIPT